MTAAGIVCLWMSAGGCNGWSASRPLPTWQSPELLYLRSQPCDRLYVEVDRVEGVADVAEPVRAIREFLWAHCDKPAGIEVKIDDPIPLAGAAGRRPFVLSLMNMQGPPTDADGRAAYLYVLFYDSRRLGVPSSPPHVGLEYPCAVYVDMAYEPRILGYYLGDTLRHELGHVLGLSKDRGHGDGAHCAVPGCLMRSRLGVPMRTWLLGQAPQRKPPTLCPQCLAELEASRRTPADGRLSFHGPVLVRRERGYTVAKLPYAMRLGFEAPEDLDAQAFLLAARYTARQHWQQAQRAGGLYFVFRPPPQELQANRTALERAARDPDPAVARLARKLLRHLTPLSPKPARAQPEARVAVRLTTDH